MNCSFQPSASSFQLKRWLPRLESFALSLKLVTKHEMLSRPVLQIDAKGARPASFGRAQEQMTAGPNVREAVEREITILQAIREGVEATLQWRRALYQWRA